MPLLLQVIIFLAAAVLLVPLGKRFGLATVLGYLITGVLLGPGVFNVAYDTHAIMQLAEYGVIMLMFVIGLELRPQRLWELRRSIFVMGGLQVGVTGTLLLLLLWSLFGTTPGASLVIGFGLALSSTAFVLQLLAEKKQLNSVHGRQSFAILLFQDMAVIPLLAVMPLISGVGGTNHGLAYFAAVVATFAGLFLASRYVMRPFFRFIANSGAHELLTAVALLIVLGVVVLMDKLNISTTLGAFFTGVLLADSEYRHELEASIQPFKGLLLGLFFMTVGMTIQLHLLVEIPWLIIGGTVALMLVKFISLMLVARYSGYPWATSVRLGVALAQGGEFAFVLFSLATQQSILTHQQADPLTLIVTCSMVLTPLAFFILEKWGEPFFSKHEKKQQFDNIPNHQHEVIIAGFGRVGQMVGRVLRIYNKEFTAIDNNVGQVDFVRKFGNAVYYGDPRNPEILRAAGVAHAKMIILAMDNVEESVSTAKYLRRTYPNLKILARARDRFHACRLMDIGVTHIWRETFLSSLDMARETLVSIGIPADEAARNINTFRQYDEDLLRRQQAFYMDEQQLIASSRAALAELESLFDNDQIDQHQIKHETSEQLENQTDHA